MGMGCKMDNVNDVDADFAKLAARGVTIVFASGDSGAGYTPPETHCSPAPGLQEGVELTGTVARNTTTDSAEECCFYSGHASVKGWTFERPNQETCSEQTIVKDAIFDGPVSYDGKKPSSDACCAQSQSLGRATWSYSQTTGMCKVFDEIQGRHSEDGATSGIGKLPGAGMCQLYSSVTGTKPNPKASSAQLGKATVKLWPSWPASSPWVTAVGSTRFVDQKVGQPEMATDQFGSGGGFSFQFDAPDEQKAAVANFLKVSPQLPPDGTFPKGGRATPDVSALGEGYQVVMHGQPSAVGGTSASAPMFAGLISLLNEARLAKKMPALGHLNPWLYKHPEVFTDITLGDNYRGRGPFVEPVGFNCTKGWDPVTGLGTPLFDKMLSAATSADVESVVV